MLSLANMQGKLVMILPTLANNLCIEIKHLFILIIIIINVIINLVC